MGETVSEETAAHVLTVQNPCCINVCLCDIQPSEQPIASMAMLVHLCDNHQAAKLESLTHDRLAVYVIDKIGDIVPMVQPEEVTEMRHILQGIRAVIEDDSHWAKKIDAVLRTTGDK